MIELRGDCAETVGRLRVDCMRAVWELQVDYMGRGESAKQSPDSDGRLSVECHQLQIGPNDPRSAS